MNSVLNVLFLKNLWMFNYCFSLPPSIRILAESFRLCNTFLLCAKHEVYQF